MHEGTVLKPLAAEVALQICILGACELAREAPRCCVDLAHVASPWIL